MTTAKVLLVDDSITMHRAVALSLKKENVELISCDNGQDGLRLVREQRPYIVLADLDMPGMTGIELCQAIKNDPTLANSTKVVLLCGSFDQVDESHLDRVPADGRLWKPFESHVLVTLIQKLINGEVLEKTEATSPIPQHIAVAPPPPPSVVAAAPDKDLPFDAGEATPTDFTRDMTQETFLGLSEPFVAPSSDPSSIQVTTLIPNLPVEETAPQPIPQAVATPPAPPQLPPLPRREDLWGSTTAATPSSKLDAKAPLAQTMETLRKELTNPPRSMAPTPPPSARSLPGADINQFRTQEKTQPIPTTALDPKAARESQMRTAEIPAPPTAKAFSPTLAGSVTQPILQAVAAQAPGVSEDQIRRLVREELDRLVNGELRKKLQDEIQKVISEIDQS